jgi:PAS domain S-box-containing protein
MRGNLLTFGLSADQEDRFRQAHLGSDLAQARTSIVPVVAAVVLFAVNDYSFLGLSWPFYAVQAVRLGLVAYTIVLLKRLRTLTDYRVYDRAEFAWGLFVALFALAIAGTRPHVFIAHAVVIVLAVFVTVLAIPNRFANQLKLCLLYVVGETLIIAAGLTASQPASVTGLLSRLLASSIAVACGWQLHAWRRREFLACEKEQAARTEAERQLAERNRAEEALRRNREALEESERRVRLKLDSILSPDGDVASLELADLIDAEALQAQMESFHAISGIPVGIIDLEGKVLVGVGWQEVCTRFHRAHPETCRHCVESDTHLSAGVPEGEHRLYKCKNNMWDVATPIVVAGRHVGNIFMGQFFFDDEEPDLDLFTAQARRYGFAEEEYLAALSRVPRFTRRAIHEGMAFYARLAHMLSRQSYSNLALARTLAERDRLTESLHQSEMRFRLALAHASVSVAAQDRDLRYIWAFNQRTARPDQIIGHFDHEIFSPEEAAHFTAIKRRVLDEGVELREQMWLDRPGGRIFLDICWEPIRDEAGGVIGVASATVDLTPAKLAEEQLRGSEGRYRTLVDLSPDAVFVHQDRQIVFANPAAVSLVGAGSLDTLIGMDILDLVHPDDRPGSCERTRAAQVGAKTEIRQLRVLRLDGRAIDCEATSIGVDYQGTPSVQVIGRDITDRKRAESLLQSTLQRFYAILSNMYSAVLLVTADGHVEFANPAFCDQFGVKEAPADLIGLASGQMLEKIKGAYQHSDQALVRIREIVERGQPVRGEELLMHDGRTCLRDFIPLTVDGDTYGRLWLHFDITDSKRTEEALRQANVQLADADRRKNEFLAVLSHELRNPLAPIKSGLHILDHAAPGGDHARRAQAVMTRQVDQLVRLVDDLLDITRITRNKVQLQRQRLEINELARRTIEDHRSSFEKAEVHVDFEPAPTPVFVDADWNRLAQVVGNLLQNAVKFTPRGGRVTVTVSTDAASRRATVRVADTGVGMAPEMVARLFEPFTQADATLDRSKGGLGLGLALVKGLVELHGGDVSAASAGLGQGSEFIVRFPLDVTTIPASTETPPARPTARRRVLVIEDNVDAADMLREVLEFGQHEVAVAYNGPAGIARAREFRPDVVLCDIGLPGMNGYEVARAFRADGALSRTCLVALSGYALPEDLQRAVEAGFERHLAKPPSFDKLEELLAAIPVSMRPEGSGRAQD